MTLYLINVTNQRRCTERLQCPCSSREQSFVLLGWSDPSPPVYLCSCLPVPLGIHQQLNWTKPKKEKKHQFILLGRQYIHLENVIQVQHNTYMQWAAVRTQQDDRRIPPHVCWNSKFERLGRTCRDTCQGWAAGKDLLPPKILLVRASGLPHWENWVVPGAGVTGLTGGGVAGTEEYQIRISTVRTHSTYRIQRNKR